MTFKRNILILTPYYLPAYKAGGPIRSIANLVDALSKDFNFYILTLDRDLLESNSFLGVEKEKWVKVDQANVFYIPESKISYSFYKSFFRSISFDVLYLNSFFDLRFSILPLINIKLKNNRNFPIVLAPRGEFSPGALKIKGFKKNIFISFSKLFRIHSNITWQASSEIEFRDIKTIINPERQDIVIAPNIPDLKPPSNSANEYDGVLRIIWSSRISPKKNLLFALEVLKEVKSRVLFSLYGLVDDAKYWEKCKQLISELPKNIVVKYYGAVSHQEIEQNLKKSHLFFLPTLGENFGHSIVEALLAGIPVMISKETPWQDLEKSNVGWDLNLSSPHLFASKIDSFVEKIANGYKIDKNQINDWIVKKILDSRVIEKNQFLFQNIN